VLRRLVILKERGNNEKYATSDVQQHQDKCLNTILQIKQNNCPLPERKFIPMTSADWEVMAIAVIALVLSAIVQMFVGL
ncbi:MAG: hypothetical protein D6756_14020, partial [Cyanobacteria bacterium J083]